MKALREAFGDEILQLGREHPEVFVIDCDIGKSCKTTAFSRELPQQYVNVGIAEQNGAGVAAGLATCGLTPPSVPCGCASRSGRRSAIPT